MYKCNLCYDRTSEGLAPMCATVCPTGSIFYGTLEELLSARPGAAASDIVVFGEQEVRTGAAVVVPAAPAGTGIGTARSVPGGYAA
jgi:Fe-S-cluster-containing dehydrogenase component